MKKKIYLLFLSLGMAIISGKSQIYTPSGTIQGSSGNNNVGIGTNNPYFGSPFDPMLQINGAYPLLYFTTTSTGKFGGIIWNSKNNNNPDQGEMMFFDGANPYLSLGVHPGPMLNLTGTGIGIGTTTPANALEVVGNVKATKFIGDGSGLTGITGASQWTSNGSNISFSTGNVGIGITSPQELLHINGNIRGNVNGALRISTGNGYIDIGPQNSGWAHIYTDRPAFIFNAPVYSYRGQFSAYSTYDMALQTAGATRMTILSSNGNVGLGTTSPAYKLDVVGDINFTGNLYTTGGTVNLKNSTNDNYLTFGFRHISGLYPHDQATISTKFVSSQSQIDFWSTESDQHGNHYIGISGGSITLRGNNDLGNMFTVTDYAIIGSRAQSTSSITYPATLITADGNATFDGKVIAKSIEVKLDVWSDDVFNHDYKLMSIADLDKFIQTNKHLPNVPTEVEVKQNGVELGDMNALLLRKVEELTKYLIEQQKTIDDLKSEVGLLKSLK